MDVTQSIYEPSLLFNLFTTTKILLCTEDTENFMTEDDLPVEGKITTRFKYPDRQSPPTDFKYNDIIQKDNIITLS